MAPRLISLASTKTSPKNMRQGQRVADWGDRRLSGTIVPTCDRPIGDGPEREANINGAGKEAAVNYKNNPLRQASKCAGDAGLATRARPRKSEEDVKIKTTCLYFWLTAMFLISFRLCTKDAERC